MLVKKKKQIVTEQQTHRIKRNTFQIEKKLKRNKKKRGKKSAAILCVYVCLWGK